MKDSIITKTVTVAEAIGFISEDQTSTMDAYESFLLNKGKYPFTPPIHMSNGVILWPPVDIHPNVEIGEGTIIGRYTNICGKMKIGSHTRIQGFCFIPDCVEIGNRVFIGPNVTFTNVKYPSARYDRDRVRNGLTVVEDFVSIGAGAVICPGVRIKTGALIGAGAVVTKDVEPGTIIVGAPGRVLRNL